jgi:transcription elongation factor
MWSDKDYETLLLKYEKALDDVERLRGENDNLLAVIETEKQIMTTLSETEADLAAAVEVVRLVYKRGTLVKTSDQLMNEVLSECRAFLARLEVNP